MQTLVMVLSLPLLSTAVAVYNGWKFRVFDQQRRLLRYFGAARAQRAA